MSLPHQLAICDQFRQTLGVVVRLSITATEALSLSEDDEAALRDLGATDALLDALRAAAGRAVGQQFEIDFEAQTILVSASPEAAAGLSCDVAAGRVTDAG